MSLCVAVAVGVAPAKIAKLRKAKTELAHTKSISKIQHVNNDNNKL